MRPANFPGRKNERRKGALLQLLAAKNTKADRLDRPPGFSRQSEVQAVSAAIVLDDVARSTRTKKDRSAHARLRA